MKARRLVSYQPGQMAIEQYEIPEILPPAAIAFNAEITAISAGTEIAHYLGRTTHRPPTSTTPYYPGYSFAGVVSAVGANVARFKPGDRVCGPLGHASHVVEENADVLEQVAAIPDGVCAEHAAFAQLGCIALNAVRLARIELGETVAVVGAGTVGLLAGRLAVLAGAFPLATFDLLASRRSIAASFGSHHVLDPTDPSALEQVRAAVPDGFDIVIEATGSPSAFAPALDLAARGGRVVLLGSTRGLVEQFDPYGTVHLKGLNVIGAHISTTPRFANTHYRWTEPANRRFVLELMRSGMLDVSALITDVVKPEEGPEAFAMLARQPDAHLGTVIDWGGDRRI